MNLQARLAPWADGNGRARSARPAAGAIAALALACSILPPAFASSEAAAANEPGRELARREEAYYEFLIGKIHRHRGDLDDAAKHLSRAAKADDSSAVRTELAETYLRMGDITRAVEEARRATEQDPANIDARKTLVEAYLADAFRRPPDGRAQATAMAIAEMRSVLRIEPDDKDLRMALARILLQEDRSAEALEEFRILRESGVETAQLGLLIGRSLLRSGQDGAAEAELRAVLEFSPRNHEALLTVAQLAEKREAWDEVAVFYGRLLEDRPEENDLRARTAHALLRSGQAERAVAVLQSSPSKPLGRTLRELLVRALKAAGRPGDALAEIESLRRELPGDPSLLIQAGRLHEERAEVRQALGAYRAAMQAAGEPPQAGDTSLEERVLKGLTLAIAALEIETGQPAAALRTLETVPREASEYGLDGWLLRVRALSAAGRGEEAVEMALEFERAASDDPRSALLLLEARLTGAARPEAEQALAAFRPESQPPPQIIAAGEILRSAGHLQLGIGILQRAVKVHPKDASLHLTLGMLFDRLGKAREAEAHLERAIELEPGDGRALNNLGYSLAERGKDLPRAEDLVRQALRGDPHNGAYHDSLGWVLFKLGRLEEAEAALTRAAELVAGDATVQEHLGDLYMKRGDRQRALAHWQAAQALQPEDPDRLREKIRGVAGEAP